jgi:hypothetical protein
MLLCCSCVLSSEFPVKGDTSLYLYVSKVPYVGAMNEHQFTTGPQCV